MPATLDAPAENRLTMNGKPVFWVKAKSVVNFKSGFGPKRLCDSLTFSTGSACTFSCAFCYVEAMMSKSPHMANIKINGERVSLEQVVIRREGALDTLRRQLESARRSTGWKGKFMLPREKPLVIYSSPLTDVCGNLALAKETIAACRIICELTPWDIRLLSKSTLLPYVAANIPPEWKHRIIYGVSTGTLDDRLAASFEEGTALVSRRLASLHKLQDTGHRTFGMICPSLPPVDPGDTEGFHRFARDMFTAIRAEKVEEVWAEVINVRGRSMVRTVNALEGGGFKAAASALAAVSMNRPAWENWSRQTFLSHAALYADKPGKFHYLQYVSEKTAPWWRDRADLGATPLGIHAAEHSVESV